MRTGKSLIFFWMVCLAWPLACVTAPVLADVHDGSDVLGLATTPDENGEFFHVDLPAEPFDLSLLVYGFDHSQGIAGWECQVLIPDGVQVTGVTLNGKADPAGVDLATCNMRVFPRIPLLAVNGIVHLATLHLNHLDVSTDKSFLLAPYSQPGPGSIMGFSLETSESNLLPFNWPGDCPDCPVFEIITTPEPTVATTWGMLKSLYR